VASFKSTLDEALNAGLLLYVVDSSDPSFRSQLQVTKTVLGEVGASETPSLLILNKRDRLNEEQAQALQQEFPDAIFLSTRDEKDLKSLRQRLIEFFESDMVDEELFIPYAVKGVIGEVRSRMKVLSESYDEKGVRLQVRGKNDDIVRLQKKISSI
jgi:GTP-binding protein HflX